MLSGYRSAAFEGELFLPLDDHVSTIPRENRAVRQIISRHLRTFHIRSLFPVRKISEPNRRYH